MDAASGKSFHTLPRGGGWTIRGIANRGCVLVIAKLDRHSRDAHFLLGLGKAGVEFAAADMPNTNRLTVRLMAVIAAWTGRQRTASARPPPWPRAASVPQA